MIWDRREDLSSRRFYSGVVHWQRKLYGELKAVRIFAKDEAINVRLNEEFELRLPVLAAAGYEWQVAEKMPGVVVTGSTFQTAGSSQVGGASEQALRLLISKPGTHNLLLVCKRAWDAAGSQTLTVEITVRP